MHHLDRDLRAVFGKNGRMGANGGSREGNDGITVQRTERGAYFTKEVDTADRLRWEWREIPIPDSAPSLEEERGAQSTYDWRPLMALRSAKIETDPFFTCGNSRHYLYLF